MSHSELREKALKQQGLRQHTTLWSRNSLFCGNYFRLVKKQVLVKLIEQKKWEQKPLLSLDLSLL